MRKTNGITLISLIITIIVLLILAGVSISVLTGYDSIPDNAKTAVDASRQDASEEQEMVDKIGGLFEKYLPTTGVYGNLYKISDTEYHLIFNSDGDIAEGYTEEQLVARGTNIRDGSNYVEVSSGVYQSDQPWGEYSNNIKKVKIEEEIKPTSIAHYFRDLTQITEIEGMEKIDTSNVTSMHSTFNGCIGLASLNVNNFDTKNVTDMFSMFHKCRSLTSLDLSGFETGNVVDMQSMFNDCSNLSELKISKFDTKNVTNMYSMFYNCVKLTTLDVSKFNTSKATSLRSMFSKCSSLTNLDVSDFDTTNVTTMYGMFNECSGLTSLDVSGFNTSNVIDMQSMFNSCSNLSSLDVSGFDTKNVTDMWSMFYKCSKLTTIDVSGFNTSEVKNMRSMFNECAGLTSLDVSNFNTNKVTNMTYMFANCSNLQTIYAGNEWTTSGLIESNGMFANSVALKGEISYNASKLDATYANYTTGYLTYKANVDENGLARENITIKPSADSNLQIVIPKGMAPALLAGSGTTTSLPGQDGSVASIMPATDWNKITTEQIDKGIVVVDHAITHTNSVPDFNEYVWVPIPESSKFDKVVWTTTYGYDADGNWGDGGETGRTHLLAEVSTANKFWEDTRTTEYTNMVTSVNIHKGFYIGRYEASMSGTIAQSKRGQVAKDYISQIEAITACASNITTQNMHLMYGIEWDSTLNWLNENATIASSTKGAYGTDGTTKTMELLDLQTNSTTWGNYRNSIGNAASAPYVAYQIQNTGASEYWKANNIYDLAGNLREWTQENYSTGSNKAIRGGDCHNNGAGDTVASRCTHNASQGSMNYGFRISFYL